MSSIVATVRDYDAATRRRIGNARRAKALALADVATAYARSESVSPEALADADDEVWVAMSHVAHVAHTPSVDTRMVVAAIVADRLACGR